MADIDDTEQVLGEMEGLENTWNGRVLAKLVKATRRSHNRVELVVDEVQALRARVDALEQAAAQQPEP